MKLYLLLVLMLLPVVSAAHPEGVSVRESLQIESIRVNEDFFPVLQVGDDVEVRIGLRSQRGLIAERLSIHATLFDDRGALVAQQNVQLKPFRRGKRSSINVILTPDQEVLSGRYDLRITVSAEDGRSRTKYRQVIFV